MKPYIICHMIASVDGRAGMVAVFDGITDKNRPATQLRLESAKQMGEIVWMKYKFNN